MISSRQFSASVREHPDTLTAAKDTPDLQQTYLYVGDGEIHILRRDTLEELTAFGDGGRQPGQFYGVHVIASDSRGNLYTAETYEGHRVQRFVYKGIGQVTKKYQGTVWPRPFMA